MKMQWSSQLSASLGMGDWQCPAALPSSLLGCMAKEETASSRHLWQPLCQDKQCLGFFSNTQVHFLCILAISKCLVALISFIV